MTRAGAGALAAAAGGGLLLQAWANHAAGGWANVAFMLSFFTIWTNAMICAAALRAALTGRAGASLWGFLAVQIIVVGLVYHGVLARTHQPEGLGWWANLLLHTATPLGTVALWFTEARAHLPWREAFLWLLWPLGYCAASLLRGAATGFYPYFFLDPALLGAGGVAVAIAALALLFLGLGLAVVAAGRRATPLAA